MAILVFLTFSGRVHATLGDALDNTSLTWTNSGNAPWISQTTTTHDGVDAAKSGTIYDSQTSVVSAQVTGPGTLSFWWKVSSEYDYDFLRFRVDGVEVPQAPRISGEVNWQQVSVTIPAGTYSVSWTYSKDTIDLDPVGSDSGWVDQVTFTPPGIVDALDNPSLTWTNSVDAPWIYQTTTTHDGVDAAKSGTIYDSETSGVSTQVTGPGTLSFWWKVSSEAGWDVLRFRVDGVDVAQAPEISGEVNWQQVSVTIPAGTHSVSWTYDKDNSDSRGSDSAWVDQVTFTPTYPVVHFDASTLALPGNTTLTTWGGQTAAGTPTHLLNQTPSGKPAVYFDGSDRMGENVIVPASAAQDFIIVAVVKPKSTGAYHNIVEDDTQSPMLWVRPAFQYEMNAGAGGTIAAGTGAGTDGWDIVIADSRLNQVYINSATPNATGGSAMAYPSSRPCDFFHRDGNQTYQGLVAEVRIYNDRAAFGGDFAGLYNEMRTKWIGTTPIARWVADDWAGGAANWVDRVGGKIASMGNPTWRPVKTPGVIFGPQNSTGIVFDGIDDYFSVTADQNPIAGKNNVTIAAVFKTTRGASGNGSWEQNPGPIYAGVPGTPNDWGLTYTAAGNAGAFFNTPIIPIPSISLIDGRTHSMILTWQDPTATPGQGVARLYVDGVLAGSTGVTDGGNGILYDGFVIGKETASTYRCFSGAIGELRFYDTVVDAAMLHSQLTTVNGYAQFANSSLTPGLNTAFSSVANPSGLPNGAVYALGTTPMNPTGKGKFLAPPTIPADVDVYLDRSPTLAAATWTPIASWVNGAAPVFASGVTLVSGEIRDTFAGPKAFYRYRVVQR